MWSLRWRRMRRRGRSWLNNVPLCFRRLRWLAAQAVQATAEVQLFWLAQGIAAAATTRPAWVQPGSPMSGAACKALPMAQPPQPQPARLTSPPPACRRRVSWPRTTCRCASKTRKRPCSPAHWQATRALEITQNRYTAGIAAKTDVLQAQTQLANAKADEAGLQRTRAQLEHAIAVLVGQAPGNFTLPVAAVWQPTVPDVPVGIPSTLLQRRPDIAAAERRVASANQQIGVAKAAYYPSLSLSASTGTAASRVADLFSAPAALWSLGLSGAQVLFKGGALDARVDGATAAYDQAVARYRQLVLSAFQNVEDQLSGTRVLSVQQALRAQASAAADQVEQQVLNRYRSGQVSYTEVITAQTTALNARRALVQATADRQTTAVALIQSLGGGWSN